MRSLPYYDGLLLYGYVHCSYAVVTLQLKYYYIKVSVRSPQVTHRVVDKHSSVIYYFIIKIPHYVVDSGKYPNILLTVL